MTQLSVQAPHCALVTGTDRPNGVAAARAAAAAGYTVALHHTDGRGAVETLVQDIIAHGGQAAAFDADLATEAGMGDVTARAAAALGRGALDVLVHADDRPGLDGILALGRGFAQQRNEGAEGNFIILITRYGRAAGPGGPQRECTEEIVKRSGLEALTRALALELAPGVRVNAITARDSTADARAISDAVQFILATRALTGQMIALGDGAPSMAPTRDPA